MSYAGTNEHAMRATQIHEGARAMLDEVGRRFQGDPIETLDPPELIAVAAVNALLAIDARLADLSDSLQVIDSTLEGIG